MPDLRSIWVSEPQQFVRFVGRTHPDVDLGALLRIAAAPDLLQREPDARLPITATWALWAAAVATTGDRSLAIRYGLATVLEQQGLFGFAVMTAPTTAEAAHRASRFLHLVTDSAQLRLIDRRDHLILRWEREGRREPGHDLANETVLAQIVSFVTQLVGRPAVTRLTFRHPAPSSAASLARLLGCPVTWSARHDEVSVPHVDLARSPRTANAALSSYFEARVAERAVATAPTTFSAQVAAAIAEALDHGEPQARQIARRLAVSERTLRRELARERRSFRVLLQEVRSRRATHLLANPGLSLTEIAFALGFSEHSAFTRAFARWFGMPPVDYREQARATAPPP